MRTTQLSTYITCNLSSCKNDCWTNKNDVFNSAGDTGELGKGNLSAPIIEMEVKHQIVYNHVNRKFIYLNCRMIKQLLMNERP